MSRHQLISQLPDEMFAKGETPPAVGDTFIWQPYGGDWAPPVAPVPFSPQSAQKIAIPYVCYLSPSHVAQTQGQAYLFPVLLTKTATLTSFTFGVNVPGSAGSVMRCGLLDDVNGAPSSTAVRADFGAASTLTGGQALVTITTNHLMLPGRYWTVIASQGAPAVQPDLFGTDQYVLTPILQDDALLGGLGFRGAPIGALQAGVTGPLVAAASSKFYASDFSNSAVFPTVLLGFA
jgi:hypothetical protein